MAKRLWSIFTDDMDKCIITHAMTGIERHHIFGGANRNRSEHYGFVVPLHRSVMTDVMRMSFSTRHLNGGCDGIRTGVICRA